MFNNNSIVITFISDTHNQAHLLNLDPCFLLCHSGDATDRGSMSEIVPFLNWLANQPACYKVFVPGNHDYQYWKKHEHLLREQCADRGIQLLIHECWAIHEPYLSIHGAPLLGVKDYPNLPEHTDLLISHEPPFGVLDKVPRAPRPGEDPDGHIGSPRLHDCVAGIHAFGHIHWSRGEVFQPHRLKPEYPVLYLNNSNCDEFTHELVHPPVTKVLPVSPDGYIDWAAFYKTIK